MSDNVRNEQMSAEEVKALLLGKGKPADDPTTAPKRKRKPKPAGGTESDVVRVVLEYLHLQGIYAWRSNTVPVFDTARRRFRKFNGLKGVADVLGVLPPHGTILAVECKTASGRLRAEQKEFRRRVEELGGVYVVARCVEDVQKALDELRED